MPPSPAAIACLMAADERARAASHGGRTAIYQAAADELGVSLQTALRWLKGLVVRNPRKRRADAGNLTLPQAEAQLISLMLMESHRKNGKRLMSVEQAVETLRANKMIRAEALDPATGEIRPLSISAIARALRAYGLHPDTLLQPAPAVSQASRHPNHVWQLDASLCVLYYLTPGEVKSKGLQVMDAAEFYKNKPRNVARIESDRVWRYAVTDHASGAIYLEYVLGAESGENLCGIFINAIQKRPDEPVHGVPFMAMLDPGSANTGALFKNLCKSLSIRVQINKPGNPRAKGQVEKAHDQIEKSFESGLKFVEVNSLVELNAAAAKWRRWFNGTGIHSRHGHTRYAAWMRITAEQLRLAPEPAVCRELARSEPETRLVDHKLQVSFRGTKFDVSVVPEVQNGHALLICRNPWRPEAAQVVTVDADGREVFYVVEPVTKDAFGFDQGAVVIGEGYRRHADTPAQQAVKAIEKLAMGEETLEAAAAARKGKRLAFDGKLDPWKHMDEALENAPAWMPKRGTELDTPLPGIVAKPTTLHVPAALAVEAARLTTLQLASRLQPMVPGWGAETYQQLARWYPEGAEESELEAIAARFTEMPKLAMAAGGG